MRSGLLLLGRYGPFSPMNSSLRLWCRTRETRDSVCRQFDWSFSVLKSSCCAGSNSAGLTPYFTIYQTTISCTGRDKLVEGATVQQLELFDVGLEAKTLVLKALRLWRIHHGYNCNILQIQLKTFTMHCSTYFCKSTFTLALAFLIWNTRVSPLRSFYVMKRVNVLDW